MKGSLIRKEKKMMQHKEIDLRHNYENHKEVLEVSPHTVRIVTVPFPVDSIKVCIENAKR